MRSQGEEFRENAKRCRRLAETATDSFTADALLALAAEYEAELAEQAPPIRQLKA